MQNNMKKTLTVLIIIAVLGLLGWLWKTRSKNPQVNVVSFETCVAAGYPVMESYPRQCRTPDGRTYAEELPQRITYTNSSSDMIVPDLPTPGAVTGKAFSVTGKARGNWFFEASFPIDVFDSEGHLLAQKNADAKGDWMTTEFVQ